MSNSYFSIVVPTYNRVAMLPEAIRSVQAQTFRDFELIIIDDGSTDDTRAVVEQIAGIDARVRYYHQVNTERGAARNRGISIATGAYIVFFDSDDEMKPDYLFVLNKGISAHPAYSFYAAKYNFLINGREKPSAISGIAAGEHQLGLVLEGNPFSCNFCIRKDNPDLVLFREDRALATTEDWMFLVENLQRHPIRLLEETGVRMHQHDARSMQQNQLLIQRRIAATKSLIEKNKFTAPALKTLWAYTCYFCSIHAYLDNNRRQSVHFILQAMKNGGIRPAFIKALLKYLAGRKWMMMLKPGK